MTEPDPSWVSADEGGSPPRRRTALVAGGAVATVVLATVGALSGWLIAGESTDDAAGPTVVDTAEPTRSAPPTTTPAGRPAATPANTPKKPVPGGELAVPDLVGLDFAEAREELRKRKLGWQLIFRESGSDRSVERTDPPAGRAVAPGITVRVMVAGQAPPVEVPDVTGEPCSKAAGRLVDEGLYPSYPGGRAGEVVQQDPPPGTSLRWNDHVRIHCGKTPAGEPTTARPAD